jgi:hypothetical protein
VQKPTWATIGIDRRLHGTEQTGLELCFIDDERVDVSLDE